MTLDSRSSELIKRIYSAAESKGAWNKALVDLFQLMGCCAGRAALIDLGRRELLACRLYGPQAADCATGVEDYPALYRQDPMIVRAVNDADTRYCDSTEAIAEEDQQRHPFMRWSLATLGSGYFYSGITSREDEPAFSLAAHFPAEPNTNKADAIELFQLIFDHVECALRLGRTRFTRASTRALLCLGPDGRVESLSSGAELLLRQRPALNISGPRLTPSSGNNDKELRRALDRVFGGPLIGGEPVAVRLEHDFGRPWILVIRPVVESFGPFGKLRRQVHVEIFDRMPAVGRLEVIQSLFGLTGREMQVLRSLAGGHSIDSSSATMGVSRNTTRAHLRSIFVKTKTTSQLELVQLCAGLTSATRDELAEDAELETLNVA
jgi:DNA-binding CsgD family transcriptional regulator